MKRCTKVPNILHCEHCKAPETSVFDPARKSCPEKTYTVDINEFKVTRLFSQKFNDTTPSDNVRLKRTKQINVKKSINTTNSFTNTNSINPVNISWSGTTFRTEYDNYLLNLDYAEKTRDALIGRKKWNDFKSKLVIHHYKQKLENAGPDWFQDLSPYQMQLTENLPQMLHRDVEEGKSPRTQEYIHEVGIAPTLSPSIISSAVKQSGGNPLALLFKLHESLVRRETEEYEKSFWEAKYHKDKLNRFSINERILLTCAFLIHYPKLLEKLDQILPQPKPTPKLIWAKRPPKPKKRKYSSPYLEPLPINDKPWYEEQAELEQEKKVLRQIKCQKEREEKESFQKKLAEQKRIADKEKEDKEMMQEAFKKKKMHIPEKSKVQQTFLGDDLPINESIDFTGTLPSRERKSEFFKTLEVSGTAVKNKSKEEIMAEAEEIAETEKIIDSHMTLKQNPDLWVEVLVSDGCVQTPIRGIERDHLYAAYINDENPKEGVTEAEILSLRRAPIGHLRDRWSQTPYNKHFQPIKKAMRDFLLKQRGVMKQMEKFYKAAMYKRGIFGPPTNNICRTSCLRDLERMAINREIKVIKARSADSIDDGSVDGAQMTNKIKVPRDLSMRELLTVKRLNRAEADKLMMRRRSSGPPIPGVPEDKPKKEITPWQSDLVSLREIPPVISKPSANQKKPYPVECKDPNCELINPEDLPMDEFTLAQKRIALLPMNKQLKAAIQFLSEKGDPLAILPNIELIPWLVRWFDKRNGIKRNLTQKDKEELMEKSKRFWTAEYKHCTSAPLPNVLKKEYTWNHKKWLMEHLGKLQYEHQRKVKHILIDNARDLFPTMYTEYFNSPLNKSYRKVFYTYFPACERDCLVHNPWDPKKKSQ